MPFFSFSFFGITKWECSYVTLKFVERERERERERIFQWVVVYLKTKKNLLPYDNEFHKMRTIFHVNIMVKLMIKFRIF